MTNLNSPDNHGIKSKSTTLLEGQSVNNTAANVRRAENAFSNWKEQNSNPQNVKSSEKQGDNKK